MEKASTLGGEMAAAEGDAEKHVENCAFCQEELRKDTYLEHPFGNFAYVSANNVLYHASQ